MATAAEDRLNRPTQFLARFLLPIERDCHRGALSHLQYAIRRKRSPQLGVWRRAPNAVYLDGVGYNGDSRNASSSDAFRVAARMETIAWAGSMLCAPILHSLGGDSFIGANTAIDAMAFE